MSKYRIEPSPQRPGWWVLTDSKNEIVILFEEHNFNDTQDVKILDYKKLFDSCGDKEPATYIARQLREMSEWAAQRHPDIVFALSTFKVEKNDDGQITIIRTKYPRFSMTVEDSCDANELSKAVNKLSEYLRKRQ